MRRPEVNDYVRLVHDIPELSLHSGEIGVVRSHWCAPELAFEVEFHLDGFDAATRALLMGDQIAIDESHTPHTATAV